MFVYLNVHYYKNFVSKQNEPICQSYTVLYKWTTFPWPNIFKASALLPKSGDISTSPLNTLHQNWHCMSYKLSQHWFIPKQWLEKRGTKNGVQDSSEQSKSNAWGLFFFPPLLKDRGVEEPKRMSSCKYSFFFFVSFIFHFSSKNLN